jgi:FtsZ-binding cell division protein ZapB
LQEVAQARVEAARLSEELKVLHSERKQVRSRIEKLLGQIDQLSVG